MLIIITEKEKTIFLGKGDIVTKKGESIMLKTMNQNEMLTVNGGFYYVPVYYYKVTWSGSYYYRKLVKTGTEQVASGSGIRKIEVVDGKRYVCK